MSQYEALLAAAAAKYGVPVDMLRAQMQQESGGNPLAVSSQGAQGLMQILPSNFKQYGVSNPNDPAQSIDAGAHMDADAYKRTGNWPDALKMYHGGTNTQNWGQKTQAYEGNIMAKAIPSDADWDKAMGASPTPAKAATAPTDAEWDAAMQQAPAAPQPGVMAAIGAGLGHGFGSTMLGIQKLAGKGLNAIGLNNAGNWLVNDANQGNANLDAQYALYQNAHPMAAGAGNLGGQTVAVSIPLFGAENALAKGGSALADAAGSGTASNVIRGATNFLTGDAGAGVSGARGLASRIASKSAEGAALGAGSAALTSPASNVPIGDQLKQGAEYGAIAGPVGMAVGSLAGKGADFLTNLISPITSDLSPKWTEQVAANRLSQALQRDGVTPNALIQKMREMGPEATPVDAAASLLGVNSGANVRNMAETVANTPGEGQALANQVLQGRMDTQPTRINDAIKNATGAAGDVHAEAADLMAQRSANAAPLYEKAFSAQVQPDARLAQFLDHPIIQKGLAEGAKTAELDALANGSAFDPASYSIQPGQPAPMSALDAAKRGLDDIVEGYRDPVTGKLNLDQYGRAVNNVRSAFVNHLDTMNPDYAAARAAWSGPSQSLDAMNMGRKALTNDPEVTSNVVQNMSPNDKQFFLSGVTRALQDKINSAPDGANAVRRIFGNSLMRDKVAAAFDNPDAFDNFARQMESEAQYADTRNSVLANSSTARRLAGAQDQADFATPLNQLISGNLGGAARSGLGSLSQWAMKPSEKQLAAQSKLLFSQDPDALANAIQTAAPGKARQAMINLLTNAKRAAIPAASLGLQTNQGR